jgi:hypothetical protein
LKTVFSRGFFCEKVVQKTRKRSGKKAKITASVRKKKLHALFSRGKVAEQYWKGEEKQRKKGASEDFLAPHPHYLQFGLMN